MKKLLRFLNHYKKETVLAPLFKLLEASFELIVPLVMAALIDTGIGNKDQGYIMRMCLILVALGAVGLISSVTAQYFSAKAATGFATELRHELFGHIQKLSYSQMDTLGTSTLITRMTNDINQVQSGVNLVLRLFLRSPFIVFGAMIMAFTVDVKAAFVFVGAIPLLSVVVFGVMVYTVPLYKKVQGELDQVLLTTRENLGGSRVIRAFNKEAEEKARFEANTARLAAAQKYVGKISGLMNPLTCASVNIALVILIYSGAIRVNIGSISQGEVVALVNYMSQILVELVKLANLIVTVTKAIACGNRIQAILDEECNFVDGDQPYEAEEVSTIEFDHVSMKYRGAGEESLSDIHFRAEAGQTIGIIGGTGSGKTSLVNLLPRFYDVSAGEIRVNGKNIREYRINDWRKKIGVIPQKAVLFKGTIASNLRWGKEDAAEEELWQALQLAQAEEFVKTKKGELEFQIEQNGQNLSGGQKQRMTIARALVRKPQILIMDDSASALDYATDAKLRMSIRNMKEKPIVFIVSQRASTVRYADQILVLDDGTLAGKGTHEELMKSCELYQEIYYSQYPEEEKKNA